MPCANHHSAIPQTVPAVHDQPCQHCAACVSAAAGRVAPGYFAVSHKTNRPLYAHGKSQSNQASLVYSSNTGSLFSNRKG